MPKFHRNASCIELQPCSRAPFCTGSKMETNRNLSFFISLKWIQYWGCISIHFVLVWCGHETQSPQIPSPPTPRAHAPLHTLLTIFKRFMHLSVLIHGFSLRKSLHLGSNFHTSGFVTFQTPNSTCSYVQWKIQLSLRKLFFFPTVYPQPPQRIHFQI